ncbi:MAG: CBS domain-containing protein [Caldilineales bacterium]|nr:CBS domain-containing protein [Caldilineales bacterium]
MTIDTLPRLTRKDFVSDQTVRWCPGCGDYAILAQVQKVMPDLGVPKENIVFISGIGCSSRFPYYMNTYGVHSIHGRAPTLATGLKLANPELSVWVVTGDGDGLSIGGNHLVHTCRRNVDLNIILFNNRIYGLTKGQYSPTSPAGLRTKSSPMGAIEQALNPISVALAAEATFIARTVDVIQDHMGDVIQAAAAHKGVSFVEVFQNCVIFYDGAWEPFSDRGIRDDNNIYLEAGKPMVFGKNNDKGLIRTTAGFEVVTLGEQYSLADLAVHDVTSDTNAWMLSRLTYPMPMGVIYQVQRPTYNDLLWGQVAAAKTKAGASDLRALYNASDTWTVSDDGQPAQSGIKGEVPQEIDEAYFAEVMERVHANGDLIDLLSEMTIEDLDPQGPITVETSARMDNALSVMRQKDIGCLLVTSADRHLTGILTEHDLLTRVAGRVENLHEVTVAQFMTPRPTALPLDAPLVEALHLMSTQGFRHLPIVDAHNLPVGVISVRDVVRFLITAI